MTTSAAEDHAKPPARRWGWKGRVCVWATVIAVAVGGTVAVAALRGPTQAKLLYYQYRVARLDLARGRVMYKYSPALTAALDPENFLKINNPALPAGPAAAHPHGADNGDDDACEILPPHVIPPGGAGDPPEVDAFNQYTHSILGDGLQVLFAHALVAPDGARRIVIAEFGPGDAAGDRAQRPVFEVLVVAPATWSAVPKVLARKQVTAAALGLSTRALACLAGQTDAGDRAAFHLAVQQDGAPVTLTGRLSPDGRGATLVRDADGPH